MGLWLLTAATALWVCFIWGHSMVPAGISSQESGAVLTVLKDIFRGLHLPVGLTEHIVRKATHFSEYLILGVLDVATLRGWGQRNGLLLLPAAAVFTPLVDETIQLFVPGRSGEIGDVWLDIFGFVTGALLSLLLNLLWRRLRKDEGWKRFH